MLIITMNKKENIDIFFSPKDMTDEEIVSLARSGKITIEISINPKAKNEYSVGFNSEKFMRVNRRKRCEA